MTWHSSEARCLASRMKEAPRRRRKTDVAFEWAGQHRNNQRSRGRAGSAVRAMLGRQEEMEFVGVLVACFAFLLLSGVLADFLLE